MSNAPNYHKHILFGESFMQTLKDFEELIARDKKILEGIDKNQLKKGIFSPAIRHLIKNYVQFKTKQNVKEVLLK